MATKSDWPARITAGAADQIKYWRKQRGMSAEKLSQACTNVGGDIPRALIADLESHRRVHISVAELLVIAAALGVAPLLLLFGIGADETTEMLPGSGRDTWRAAKWFTGEAPMPGAPGDEEYIDSITGDWLASSDSPLYLYRTYDAAMAREHVQLHLAALHEQQAAISAEDQRREELACAARARRDLAGTHRLQAENARNHAEELGYLPPGG